MSQRGAMWWPCAGLLLNALTWGVSWWPLRHLQSLGLHPLWATVIFFALGGVLITLWQPQAWRAMGRSRAMWWLTIAAGSTNAAFNWAVTVGDVVRVVLLFYLMPLWAVGLAWLMMGERVTLKAMLHVLLALLGAALVLWPSDGGWPRFDGLADWLGLLGGVGFAWTNVLLRQQAQEQAATRALAMFIGGAACPLVLGVSLYTVGMITPWPAFQWQWAWVALGVAVAFFMSNLALQYGAARLPVQITAVVMLTEILFAAGSSMAWGGAVLTLQVVLGGALILLAALLSSLPSSQANQTMPA
jgi:drug/metabolite transporter (DMT)-like permease